MGYHDVVFPPSPNEDLQKVVTGMWESLQRAGEHFDGEAQILPREGGSDVVLYLKERVPKDAPRFIKSFVLEYMKQSGWKAERLRMQNGYLTLFASRAESSLSKNRETRPSGSIPAKP